MHGIHFEESDANRHCGVAGEKAARRGRRRGDSSGVESEILRSEALRTRALDSSASLRQIIKWSASEYPVQGEA